MKNVLKTLALIPLGLTAAVSTTETAIQKKDMRFLELAQQTTLTISNKEMGGIMKIIKSLEASGLLIKDVSGTIQN